MAKKSAVIERAQFETITDLAYFTHDLIGHVLSRTQALAIRNLCAGLLPAALTISARTPKGVIEVVAFHGNKTVRHFKLSPRAKVTETYQD